MKQEPVKSEFKKFKFFDLNYKKDNLMSNINTLINFKKTTKPYNN